MKPENLLYAKTHEWVCLETNADGTKIATIGLSGFALKSLTDLVYLELPQVGRSLEAGEMFGEIESVKAVSELYSPVAGEIVEVNDAVADRLESLVGDPYQDGWFVKIRMDADQGIDRLLDAAAYEKHCQSESH
ncbi:MAG: glycine cleavage system protein GcvH [Planctomycetaceae bacterium]|nr:glycine cleavage system protein GcvH [Planctomycetaceae bacterium]